MNVIVLNADNTYIGSITWQQSIILIHKGKVEVLKATDRIVRNITREWQYVVPRVVRLIKFVKQIYKKSNVPYSKRAIFVRDKYVCQYCGVQLDKKDCTVDHIVPKSLGGRSTWENCVTSCTDCNNYKGDMPLSHCNLKLRKRPERPSVSDFLRMKALNILLDDIE